MARRVDVERAPTPVLAPAVTGGPPTDPDPQQAAGSGGAGRPSWLRRPRMARWGGPRGGRTGSGEAPVPTGVELDIDPSDPVLAVLEAAPGPVDVEELPSSPAVRRMREQGVEIVVPLVTSGELVGLLALGHRLSEREYSHDDRRLLDNLARYAAPALRLGQLVRQQQEEARTRERIDQELRVAQLIQQQFLPQDLPELEGWHVAVSYRPARTVGGDFYDLIPVGDGRVMVVVGDVTDKGVPAALVMASTQALLRSTATVETSPGAVLARVNDLLHEQIPLHMFVTCLVLVVDPATGRVRFANAGHNLPYVRRGDEVIELTARGMPLGLMPGSAYQEHEAVIEPGDLVLLYSDGVTEQHDADGQMFGFERTKALVAKAASGDELVGRCLGELADFAHGVEQEDDVTLVALHRGEAGGSRRPVTFSVPSVAGNERLVMDRVAELLADDLPRGRMDSLRTAVAEAAMNAIEHGNREQEYLPVEVVVRRTPEAVTVEVTDFGRGRPEGDVVEPRLELKLAGLQDPRGWGLFLMRKLVDTVTERVEGERHTVGLVMHTAHRPGTGSHGGGGHDGADAGSADDGGAT